MRRLRHVIRPAPADVPPDRGLDGLTLLLAASGSVYGTFIPVFLTLHRWTQAEIGFLLALNTVASMACQVPAGLLIDLLGARRRLALAGAVIGMGLVPLMIVLVPSWLSVTAAMLLQAAAGSLLTPAVSAISLAVAGEQRFSERLGRNSRYGSIGAAAGALIMGVFVNADLADATFLTGAAMTLPTLWAIAVIRRDLVHRPDHAAAQLGPPHPVHAPPRGHPGWRELLRDRRLLIFALCTALFSVASAGVLQLATVSANHHLGRRSGLVIAMFVILPQLVVAIVAPAVARAADVYGRRAVLLAGFATLPLRAGLFAVLSNSYALIPVQVLEGLGGTVFGVVQLLVAADLTRRTGFYTLCLSLLGLAGGLGTAISNTVAGVMWDRFGGPAAFWTLAACGLLAVLLVLAMPETAPPRPAHGATRGVHPEGHRAEAHPADRHPSDRHPSDRHAAGGHGPGRHGSEDHASAGHRHPSSRRPRH